MIWSKEEAEWTKQKRTTQKPHLLYYKCHFWLLRHHAPETTKVKEVFNYTTYRALKRSRDADLKLLLKWQFIKRMAVFGHYDGLYRQFKCADSSAWTHRIISTLPPDVQQAHVAVERPLDQFLVSFHCSVQCENRVSLRNWRVKMTMTVAMMMAIQMISVLSVSRNSLTNSFTTIRRDGVKKGPQIKPGLSK